MIEKNLDTWKNSLYTPTMINKIGKDYFIIDCWHHRVIYNDNLTDDISKWKTLTEDILGGHSIASDGELYLIDDTDNGKIRVFKNSNNNYKEVAIIDGVTGRPHFIKYDESTKCFYVICSITATMCIFKNDNGQISFLNAYNLGYLQDTYVRSFNIIDGFMYFVSGPNKIIKVKYDDFSFKVVDDFKVPSELTGMNFIEKIEDYFYITSYTNSNNYITPMFVRIKDLKELILRKYEDLYFDFGFKGTPYYISQFENKYFITEIDKASGIKSFEVINNKIEILKPIIIFKEQALSLLAGKRKSIRNDVKTKIFYFVNVSMRILD